MTLKGRTLFITGASRGIGLAIALRAARDGANIVIAAKTDKPHPKLPGTIFTAADDITRAGGNALPLVVDVRDEAQVKGAIEKAAATFGGLDIVVNHASRVNALWPRTTIATAAMKNLLGGERVMRMSRTPEIMADAAYLVFQKPARRFTGNCLIDDTFLAAEGVTDFEKYRVDAAEP